MSTQGAAGTDGSGPFSVAFSPRGLLLATANSDSNTVTLFRVEGAGAQATLTPVGEPVSNGTGVEAYSGFPLAVAFSPGGGCARPTTTSAAP